MGPLDAVFVLLGVGAPAWYVLRETAAFGRPPAPPKRPTPPKAPKRSREPAAGRAPRRAATPGPAAEVASPPAGAVAPHVEPSPRAAVTATLPATEQDTSMLAGLASVEPDEPSSSLRRAGLLLVLLAVVLVVAAGVGAGIFRAVTGLG